MPQRKKKCRGYAMDEHRWVYGYFFEDEVEKREYILVNHNETQDKVIEYEKINIFMSEDERLNHDYRLIEIIPGTSGLETYTKDFKTGEYVYEGDIVNITFSCKCGTERFVESGVVTLPPFTNWIVDIGYFYPESKDGWEEKLWQNSKVWVKGTIHDCMIQQIRDDIKSLVEQYEEIERLEKIEKENENLNGRNTKHL